MNEGTTFKDVWKTLRAVDTSKIEYQKSGLSYVGWADAWGCIIGDLTREFSLPVMTAMMPMKSIPNPTSRDISDAKARCLVKVLAMFGLGLHLWEKQNNKPGKPRDVSSDPF